MGVRCWSFGGRGCRGCAQCPHWMAQCFKCLGVCFECFGLIAGRSSSVRVDASVYHQCWMTASGGGVMAGSGGGIWSTTRKDVIDAVALRLPGGVAAEGAVSMQLVPVGMGRDKVRARHQSLCTFQTTCELN